MTKGTTKNIYLILHSILQGLLIILALTVNIATSAQTILYTMPEETALHEGTWIQWPHNHLYGPWYRDDVSPTFVAMTDALQSGEKVHIIAYDNTELIYITGKLNDASVPLTNIEFYLYETDDVWVRDNGPMFVYDQNNNPYILDWGFNGWGNDAPYAKCNVIPQAISEDLGLPLIDLNSVVLEGGAIEHDGHGTMMATRSSITHSSRNPDLTEAQIEDTITTYMGITNFIWLDGVYGQDITDQHIDGFVKFANDSTIITMNNADLLYWLCPQSDIDILYNASNKNGDPYHFVYVPLTQNNVVTTYGNNLGYKGSYVNYYVGNEVVLVPTYNDPNDDDAMGIIQSIHPNRTVMGIDVRNLYEYGGMVHCVTQQQPIDLTIGVIENKVSGFILLQNSPNPADNYTRISFSIEPGHEVSLGLYTIYGKCIKTITPLPHQQSVQLNTSDLDTGMYLYTLKVDGSIMDSKKMIINKEGIH